MRTEPKPGAQPSLLQPCPPPPPALYPSPQSLDLPVTTRKPATAPPPGPAPSHSEGQCPLECLPPLPRAHSFQQTWGWGSTHHSARPETQARPPGPKDNTPSPGTAGRARPLSPQPWHPPARLKGPKRIHLKMPNLAPGRQRSYPGCSAQRTNPAPTFQFHAGGKKTTSHLSCLSQPRGFEVS